MANNELDVRYDKFLWAVRLFKTRSDAADACRNGRVFINELTIKPSREVKLNEEFEVKQNPIYRKYKVIKLLNNRVGAKLVSEHIEDITPAHEIEKLEMATVFTFSKRDRGTGRPTKQERREIDNLMNDAE